jgi:small subunit ribosomal protein S4
MGDPRKTRRKYDKPSHPWQGDRIAAEKVISEEYGLHNKKEIWRMETLLRKFKNQIKSLASRMDAQSRLEEKQLVERLISLGLMKLGDPLDVVLGLTTKDIFERRLQTMLVRKGLARSMKQARQFITHRHIIVDKKKITFPSYVVGVKEESLIEFVPTSTLSKEDHPERMIKETAKDKADKKRLEKKEEAPPTFSEDEIKALEERGAIERKAAADKLIVEENEKKANEAAAKHDTSKHKLAGPEKPSFSDKKKEPHKK